MKKTKFLLFALFATTLPLSLPPALATTTNASPPESVILSADLVSSSNDVAFNGAIDIKVALYPANSGGTALWSECWDEVTVTSGRISLQLGASSATSASDLGSALSQGARFAELMICDAGSACSANCDAPMTPRMTLGSVPYALVAKSAQKVGDKSVTELIQASANVTQSKIETLTAGAGSNASDLHHHDSQYVRLGSSINAISLGSGSSSAQLELDTGKLYLGTSPDTRQQVCTYEGTPDEGQILQWIGGRWIPANGPASSGGASGDGSTLTNLNASNISSGTLSLSRLASGTTGQVLKVGSGTPMWGTLSTMEVPEGGSNRYFSESLVKQALSNLPSNHVQINPTTGEILLTGIIPANLGGTGLSTPGNAGSLLRSNGSAWESFTPTYLTSYTETDPSVNAVGKLNLGIAPCNSDGLVLKRVAGSWTCAADSEGAGGTLSSTLNPGHLFVGSAGSVAMGVALTGDASITNAGVLTVSGLQGQPVANTTPTANQVLAWDSAMSRWAPTGSPTLTGLTLSGAAKLAAPAAADNDGFIDFSTGNVQYTTNSCGAMTLNNMISGNSYSLVVQGSSSGTCSFTAYSGSGTTGPLTVKMPSDHAATTASKHTIYSFLVAGSHVYVSWLDNL